jgi:putative transposase
MLKVPNSRKGITIIGGMTEDGRVVAQHTQDSMNALGFIGFLTFLLRVLPDEKLVVFVDQHPMHKTLEVKKFVEDHQERLGLEYVPTYAPECNPIEWLWAWVKGKLVMRVFDGLAELKAFWGLALIAAQEFGLVQKFWGASAIAGIN